MRRMLMLRSRSKLSPELRSLPVYYLVDYDFKGRTHLTPHPEYGRFYKEFEEEFGESIAKFRDTNSVLILPSLEGAVKVKEIIEKHGGIANVRKCQRI